MINHLSTLSNQEVKAILKKGSKCIAPLWSLENFVAVNPYLNISDKKFGDAMSFLNKSGKVQATLSIQFYLDAIRDGRVVRNDIEKALEGNRYKINEDVDLFIKKIHTTDELVDELYIQTLADVASKMNGKNWSRFMIDRISFWASAYFDNKQASWNTTDQKKSLYAAWKQEAEVDYAPEAMGLNGFRAFAKQLPENHLEAAAKALKVLNLSDSMVEGYLSSLVIKMNGWAGFAARLDWEAGLAGNESNVLEEFISVMLVWEMGLKELINDPSLGHHWSYSMQECEMILNMNEVGESLAIKLILQEAFDIANQRVIIDKINQQKQKEVLDKSIPDVQAIFCIDVRSEVFRRNLEATNHKIDTLGFAGFFAFPINYVPLAHDKGVNQCPVLLSPTHTIHEALPGAEDNKEAIEQRANRSQIKKTWKTFKQSAISCFSFVSPLGLYFLPKLLSDSLGYSRPVSQPEQFGLSQEQNDSKGVNLNQDNTQSDATGIPLEDRCRMAASALRAMSLTENFAPIVLITGHGASSINNPHATGLDCGACGGHSGEANSKVAVAVLNDKDVRISLKEAGINVPDETVFVAALHDTTTDRVQLYDHSHSYTDEQITLLKELKYSLSIAGDAARNERAKRMNISNGDIQKQVLERSKDWSQVRPEWGLAGCSSFIVAPRERTEQLNFGGKSFMHNYSWEKDEGFGVLELIMTAPMVVTSWINLQYYASTVDNKRFGSGNKTLHNVVGGVGVLEGFNGDLRVGLPWQSVNDGENYQHEPQRLNVIIEAPVDEMSKILEKHESIRQLCDNQWIFLFSMNKEGKVAYQYTGDLQWEVIV